MNEEGVSRDIIGITEKAVEGFASGAAITEREIMSSINRLIAQLDVGPQGNVKPNSANLRLLRGINKKIEKLVITPKYLKRLDKYLGNFAKVKGITDGLFNEVAKDFKANKAVFKDTLAVNLELTSRSLKQSGISANVVKPITDLVQKGITSGMSVQQIENDLRLQILGDQKRLGGLQRYVKQISRDALNQYSRNYNKAISDDLSLEWYYYSGSVIKDTREYCEDRAGRYFHRAEVEDVPSPWAGMIPGTNSGSIFINAGGYNCRHIWMPVLIDVVPRDVIDRNIAMGNYRVEVEA
jgi:hypothetical protein